MILLKDATVSYEDLTAEMYYALGVASALKWKMFSLNTVVTALLDGVHNPGSLHPIGRAADIRSVDLDPAQRLAWFHAIQAELEPMGFDCVWENGGATAATTAAHIHIEFQPKAGEKFWHIL